jgi:hypothetical protein
MQSTEHRNGNDVADPLRRPGVTAHPSDLTDFLAQLR